MRVRSHNSKIRGWVGTNVKLFRLARNYTVSELSALTGIVENSLYQIERHELNVTIFTLEVLANGLGCRYTDLVKKPSSPEHSFYLLSAQSGIDVFAATLNFTYEYQQRGVPLTCMLHPTPALAPSLLTGWAARQPITRTKASPRGWTWGHQRHAELRRLQRMEPIAGKSEPGAPIFAASRSTVLTELEAAEVLGRTVNTIQGTLGELHDDY